jgi:hypothetical protein
MHVQKACSHDIHSFIIVASLYKHHLHQSACACFLFVLLPLKQTWVLVWMPYPRLLQESSADTLRRCFDGFDAQLFVRIKDLGRCSLAIQEEKEKQAKKKDRFGALDLMKQAMLSSTHVCLASVMESFFFCFNTCLVAASSRTHRPYRSISAGTRKLRVDA